MNTNTVDCDKQGITVTSIQIKKWICLAQGLLCNSFHSACAVRQLETYDIGVLLYVNDACLKELLRSYEQNK